MKTLLLRLSAVLLGATLIVPIAGCAPEQAQDGGRDGNRDAAAPSGGGAGTSDGSEASGGERTTASTTEAFRGSGTSGGAATAQAKTVEAEGNTDTPTETMDNFFSGTVKTLDGETVDLADYAGKTTLVVNVASECGYTPQYTGLQKLHEELGGESFQILAFPSNDFGGQEPGTNEQIAEFCDSKYGVTFAMFDKVSTRPDGSPVYDRLAEMTGERPSWNFCKYIISPDGTSATFFASRTTPQSDELRQAIDAAGK